VKSVIAMIHSLETYIQQAAANARPSAVEDSFLFLHLSVFGAPPAMRN
jgi:hypothetical protein